MHVYVHVSTKKDDSKFVTIVLMHKHIKCGEATLYYCIFSLYSFELTLDVWIKSVGLYVIHASKQTRIVHEH